MTLPLSERVIAWAEARIARITVANGFYTNIGAKYVRARKTFDKAALPASTLFEGAEAPSAGRATSGNASFQCSHSFTVEGHAKADQADTGRILGLMRADIKRALMEPDASGSNNIVDADGKIGSLQYAGSDGDPRPNGGSSEAIAVDFVAVYTEGWGDPTRPL